MALLRSVFSCSFILISNYEKCKMKSNMRIEYDPEKLKFEYCDYRSNIRRFGKHFAEELNDMLNFISFAKNAYDALNRVHYKMHMLKGELQGAYSLSPDNKKTKWRVIAICINDEGKEVAPIGNEAEFLKNIKIFRLRRISDHYE